MNLDAVRTFVAVADAGQFQDAAADLGITQQAVSKRVAGLERDLGVRLLDRTARGARPTADGQAFLAPARALLQAEQRAADAVRPARRALRVDVINPRIAPARLLRDFHDAHPDVALEVVTRLLDADASIAAVASGEIDAAFRAVTRPARQLPDGVAAARVLDEPIQVITGPGHALAGLRAVTPAELARHRIWMPAIVPGTEWAAFYGDLAAAFGITIDASDPNFGTDAMLDMLAGDPALASFAGAGTRLHWPDGHGLRRIEVRDPTPAYPHSLIWRRDNPHPALAALRTHLGLARRGGPAGLGIATWTPAWAAPLPGPPRSAPAPPAPAPRAPAPGVPAPPAPAQLAPPATPTAPAPRPLRAGSPARG
jgi:DNA-binding transcriptional LysR family regulator